MTKESLLSSLRALLILVGTYLVGHSIFGHTVTEDIWTVIISSVVTVASTIWGIATKTATIEGIESAVRSVVTGIGGILASAGVLSGDNLNAILGFITAVLPTFQSSLSRSKNKQIATGKVEVSSTTGKVTTASSFIGSSSLPGKN